MYIPTEIWSKNTQQGHHIQKHHIPDQLKQIRQESILRKPLASDPNVSQWLTEPYDEKEIPKALTGLTDEKICRGRRHFMGTIQNAQSELGPPIQCIMNKINASEPRPERWEDGSVVHIYKKNDQQDFDNYRPIYLTHIIYKIWTSMPTERIGEYYTSSPPVLGMAT